MSWNYRVIEEEYSGEKYFAVHTVFYNESGIPELVGCDPVRLEGTSIDGLKQEIIKFNSAVDKEPIKASFFIEEESDDN